MHLKRLQKRQLTTYPDLKRCFEALDIQSLMVVGGSALNNLHIQSFFNSLKGAIDVIQFSDYTPNPTMEEVNNGVKLFIMSNCDAILAIGGGSAIDVAKCIKYYRMAEQQIPFFAIPTTAGTGSEATHFAVVYAQGEKMSIAHPCLIPDFVLFDAQMLKSLSLYQRKCTMLDALCHAIESFWSVKASQESRALSVHAIQIIVAYYRSYLNNDDMANFKLLEAANIAGQAINLTQTTAAHAMCYKLTSLYGIPHGYAAALCCRVLWKWMLELNLVSDILKQLQKNISYNQFVAMLEEFDMPVLKVKSSSEYSILVNSVNVERLQNHPVALDNSVIEELYRRIL